MNLLHVPLSRLRIPDDRAAIASHRDFQYQRLRHSVQTLGLLLPLVVTELATGDYLVIDGCRRFFCAKELSLETLPCVARPALTEQEFAAIRGELTHRLEVLNWQEFGLWQKDFDFSLTEAKHPR